jgi:hypothetical protein
MQRAYLNFLQENKYHVGSKISGFVDFLNKDIPVI